MVDINWQSVSFSGSNASPQYIQSTINANPAGTTYVLKDGIHRGQSLTLKEGDTLLFESRDAVLSGAQDISGGWTNNGDGRWYKSGISFYDTTSSARMRPGYLAYREWPIVDGEPLAWRSSNDLTSHPYCAYRSGSTLWINRDPSNGVEIARTHRAIQGLVNDVTIGDPDGSFKGIIENYGAQEQGGGAAVIGGCPLSQGTPPSNTGWEYHNVEIRNIQGCAIRLGDQSLFNRSMVHHVGQLGMGNNYADEMTITASDIHTCNIGGWQEFWEAGNTKFARSEDGLVKQCYFHNETHPNLTATSVLWFDISDPAPHQQINNWITDNIIADNVSPDGSCTFGTFFMEISLTFHFRRNVIMGGNKDPEYGPWVRPTQQAKHYSTLVSDSRGTSTSDRASVWDNHLYNVADGLGGVSNNRGGVTHVDYFRNLSHQDASANDPYTNDEVLTGVWVFNNSPTSDLDWQDNAYYGISAGDTHWRSTAQDNNIGTVAFSTWQSSGGYDINGIVVAPTSHPYTDPEPLDGGMSLG